MLKSTQFLPHSQAVMNAGFLNLFFPVVEIS